MGTGTGMGRAALAVAAGGGVAGGGVAGGGVAGGSSGSCRGMDTDAADTARG